MTAAVDDRVEHRPDRVARSEHGPLLAEGREVNRFTRLETLDARITRSVERDAATIGQPAQELPANHAWCLAQERVHVHKTTAAVCVHELEKGVDRRLRCAPCTD